MRSAVGFQYLRDDERGEAFSGAIPDDATDPTFSAEEYATLWRITKSLHARQHFGWSRVFVTGTLRVDRPSADLFGTIYSPSVDVSWMPISRADQRSPIILELRLRAAYGRGGGHLIPTLEDSPLGVRPSDETAERMTEVELGADLALLDDRLLAQITAYRATNDQGLVDRSPPGGGPTPSYSTDGEFRIGGIE